MTEPGLMQISPDLVDRLRRSTDETRHQIVERACRLAMQRAGVTAPELNEALDAIRQRRFGVSSLRINIDALEQQLDEVAWDIQDRIVSGDTSEAEYLRAFAKARAVAAIGLALDGTLSASFDSLYEAYYAIDNRDEYMAVVAD